MQSVLEICSPQVLTLQPHFDRYVHSYTTGNNMWLSRGKFDQLLINNHLQGLVLNFAQRRGELLGMQAGEFLIDKQLHVLSDQILINALECRTLTATCMHDS